MQKLYIKNTLINPFIGSNNNNIVYTYIYRASQFLRLQRLIEKKMISI